MKKKERISRRGMIQGMMTIAAAPVLLGAMTGMAAAENSASKTSNSKPDLPLISQKRTLGSGDAAMEVSAIGFGVMGCNYNRGDSRPAKDD